MEWQIYPLRGVDKIRFGMTPTEVSELIGSEPKSFKRTPLDSFPCDYFEQEGVFFYYDSNGYLEAAEFAYPARPIVEGLTLLGVGFSNAIATLSNIDAQIEKQVDGAIAYELGISIYAPLAKNDATAPIETVLAFRPGYYN